MTTNTENSTAIDDAFSLRMHRARSWCRSAERQGDDDDLAVICLWVAFNAAYARDLGSATYAGGSEKERFREFVSIICSLDEGRRLHDLVWNTFAGPIRSLLDNQYVYQPFWNYLNGTGDDWREGFEKSRKKAKHALSGQDTETVLCILFDRLYTLRNQLMHGGATWKGSVNRQQLRDAHRFLAQFMPVMMDIMQTAPQRFSGKPFYPVVKDGG